MTSKIEARLIELGHPLPDVVPPVAAYIPAVVTGNLVMTAGQLPMVQGKLAETGKVPSQVSPERAKELAQISALNCLAAVKYAIGDLDRITRIVKVTGFIASDADFSGHPMINNGASEFLGQVFGDAGIHARTTVGVSSLPLDAPVEVELIVEFN
jgi:enamine deaminase RidA (YjgF/YER057c/UK114 family)